MKVLEAFKKHKTPLRLDVEMPTIETIKRFVAAGNGVALLPRISVEAELVRGELISVPVRELKLERKLRIIYRKNGQVSHAAKAFLKVAETVAATDKGQYLFERER
jgi:DNA-binding transcriptional LysR family regulator